MVKNNRQGESDRANLRIKAWCPTGDRGGQSNQSERGSATIMVLAIIAAVALILGTVVSVARINQARETTATIADLSALAAADALHNLDRPPCPVAVEVARYNTTFPVETSCTQSGADNILVCVQGTVLRLPVRSCALAGPAP